MGSSEESSPLAASVSGPCGVIPRPVPALPPVALSNCTDPFTVPGSCSALSFLPVLLRLLVLCLSPSFKALLSGYLCSQLPSLPLEV